MKLHAKISSQFDENGLIEYEVLPGATFIDTYNEELDSGSILIAHQTRRMDNINPYDWVRVYDEDGKFAKTMLIDDYTETRCNIYEPIYDYTINLMSETKLLEKIQLPNRQWQHSLTTGQKTISQVIKETCELYVPKVKVVNGDSWKYDYLIDFSDFYDENSEIYRKFNVKLNDLSLSQPTLRQCLTAFMIQIGCIPTVRDGKLSYLDFRAEPGEMNIYGNTFSQTQKSAASDSYVNELVSQGDNILDTENVSVSETLGFRDRTKVFLKQTENLYLETRYPIYKVEKLNMSAWIDTTIRVSMNPSVTGASIFDMSYDVQTSTFRVNTLILSRATILKRVISWGIYIGNTDSAKWTPTYREEDITQRTAIPGYYSDTFVRPLDATGFVYALLISVGGREPEWIYTSSWMLDNSLLYWYPYGHDRKSMLFKTDITALCVENGRRSLLDTDFMSMTNDMIENIDDLAKWQYGTVGYNIGGNTIEGWSSTYSYMPTNSWWSPYSSELTVTYIENMTNKLLSEIKESEVFNSVKLNKMLFGESVSDQIVTHWDWELSDVSTRGSATNNFVNWFFDIEYQPLNSLSVRYTKSNEDMPITFQQLDSPSNAISSMDMLALNEADTIDRLGNATYSISQYADNEHWDEIQWFEGSPLKNEDNIVFQIVYSFDVNGTAVNYFASKSAIIKNYFTSIQTKYRAYQYVGYEQAVNRKENTKVYALLSETDYPLTMNQKVWFGTVNYEGYVASSKIGLLSPFDDDFSYDLLKINMGYQGNALQTFKNECSVLTYKTNIILNQEEFDNVSAGLSLIKDSRYNNIGGGVPQNWYMWNEEQRPYERRLIGWMSDISELYETNNFDPTEEELNTTLTYIANMPDIKEITNIPLSIDNRISYNPAIISICDLYHNRTDIALYKDYSEVINQSLQIEYYTDSADIEFGDWFADSICWKGGNKPNGWEKIILADNGDRWVPSGCLEINPTEMSVKIINLPDNTGTIKLGLWKDGEFRQTITFKNARIGKKYYLRLNDTKTTRIFNKDSGIRYLMSDIRDL